MLQSTCCELEVTESLCNYDALYFIQAIVRDFLSISVRFVMKVFSRHTSTWPFKSDEQYHQGKLATSRIDVVRSWAVRYLKHLPGQSGELRNHTSSMNISLIGAEPRTGNN